MVKAEKLTFLLILVLSVSLHYIDERAFSRVHLFCAHLFLPSLVLFILIKEGIEKRLLKRISILTIIPLAVSGLSLFNLKSELDNIEIFHIASAILGLLLFYLFRKKNKHILYTSLSFILVSQLSGLFQTVGYDYFLPRPIEDYEVESLKVERDKQFTTFKKKIHPILEKKCHVCHNSEVQNGGLDLTSFKSITGKGHFHKFINSKNIYKSGFFLRSQLNIENEKHMPKSRGMLSSTELSIIKDWVNKGGLSFTRESVSYSEKLKLDKKNIWIFDNKLKRASKSIDKSIEKRISSVQFKKERLKSFQLIRKLRLNLTGLLPSKHELDRFIQKKISYDSLVDSLIQSNTYAQQRTTEWLDFTGYFENKKNFSSQNLDHINYLIEVFNKDINYFSFLKSYTTPPKSTFSKTKNTNFFKFQKYEKDEDEVKNYAYLISAENSIENLFSFTLGVNLRCAQCHDHQYTPISNFEYYNQLSQVDKFYQLRELEKTEKNLSKNVPLNKRKLSIFTSDETGHKLSLNDWITSTKHGPGFLTARTYVNFVWSNFMGMELIKNGQDHFKNNGPPIYINLVNSLTLGFIENNLSTKWLIKNIVKSDAYKNTYHFENDKFNFKKETKLRGESIRDILFQILGKLNTNNLQRIQNRRLMDIDLDTSYRSIFYSRNENSRFNNLLMVPRDGRALISRNNSSKLNNALFFNNSSLINEYINLLKRKYDMHKIGDISKLYKTIFQRDINNKERSFWTKVIHNKTDPKIILHSIISSNELIYIK